MNMQRLIDRVQEHYLSGKYSITEYQDRMNKLFAMAQVLENIRLDYERPAWAQPTWNRISVEQRESIARTIRINGGTPKEA